MFSKGVAPNSLGKGRTTQANRKSLRRGAQVADADRRLLKERRAELLELVRRRQVADLDGLAPHPDDVAARGHLDVDLDGVVGLVVDVQVEGRPLDEDPVLDGDQLQRAVSDDLGQLHEVHLRGRREPQKSVGSNEGILTPFLTFPNSK